MPPWRPGGSHEPYRLDEPGWAGGSHEPYRLDEPGWTGGSHEPYRVGEPERSQGRPRGWTRMFPGPTASGSVWNVFRTPIGLDSRVYFTPPRLLPGSLKNHCAGGSVQNLGTLVL